MPERVHAVVSPHSAHQSPHAFISSLPCFPTSTSAQSTKSIELIENTKCFLQAYDACKPAGPLTNSVAVWWMLACRVTDPCIGSSSLAFEDKCAIYNTILCEQRRALDFSQRRIDFVLQWPLRQLCSRALAASWPCPKRSPNVITVFSAVAHRRTHLCNAHVQIQSYIEP